DIAELGGQLHLLAPTRDRAADQLFVGERAVHVGGVEEGDAQVEGAANGVDTGRLVSGAVELRHTHAAEAEGGDGQGVLAGAEGAGGEGSVVFGHETIPSFRARYRSSLRPRRDRTGAFQAVDVDADLAVDRPEMVLYLGQLVEHRLPVGAQQ